MNLYLFENSDRAGRCRRIQHALFGEYGAKAENICIVKDERGRPLVSGIPGQYVSIADSRNLWAVAFSGHPVGIDVQYCRIGRGKLKIVDFTKQLERCRRISELYFHPEEYSWIFANGGEAKSLLRFFMIWTAKEAYVKYTGSGINGNFSRFNVLDRPDGVCFSYFLNHIDPEAYEVKDDSNVMCICQKEKSEIRVIRCGGNTLDKLLYSM